MQLEYVQCTRRNWRYQVFNGDPPGIIVYRVVTGRCRVQRVPLKGLALTRVVLQLNPWSALGP